MKKLLLAILLALIPSAASAECNGLFPPLTICGNTSQTQNGIPTAIPFSSVLGNINLADAHILIGNPSNVAAPFLLSGDGTLSDVGVFTLAASGVTAGTYGDGTHSTQVTFDAKGRATSASNVTITHASGDLPLSGGTMSGPIVPLVIGHTFYADQYGTFHDFVHDDSAPINAAISAAVAAGGGTVVLGPYAYWADSASISVPRGVSLTCGSYYQPPSRVSGGGVANYQNAPCSLYFASGYTLLNSGELTKVNIFADLVHFTPMDASSTRAQMEAYIASFTGTGITIGNGTLGSADGGIVRNVAIGGFAKCLSVGQAGQLKLIDILGDCTNGMSVTQSYDDDFLRGIEFWPFLTANLTHVADSWTISSIADNGSGLWRLTLSAATNITTGEQLWVNPGTTAQGASGFWTVTAIDSTHVDLQGSASAPTTTANTTNGQTYIAVASTANLQPGMTVSGAGIPAGATIGTVWRGTAAISLDQSHPATATATGVTLTFGSTPYTSGGTLNYNGAFRFGTAFALGRADGLTCNACFAFGYQIGFNLNDAFGLSLVNTQVDNNGQIAANQNITPIGIEFTGTQTYGNFLSGSLITSDGVNILSNASNTAGSYANTVEGFRTAGSTPLPSTAVEIDNGALIVQGLQDGGAHTIAIAPAAGISVLTANQLAATIVYSNGTPNWQGAGNNLGGIAGFNAPANTAMGATTFTSATANDTHTVTVNGANDGNGASMSFLGNGTVTPNKYFRVISGVMQWLNSTYTVAIMSMDDIGDLTIVGAFKAASGQFTGLNTAGIVTNDATGHLGTETAITTAQGGLGANNSSASGIPIFASGVVTITAANANAGPALVNGTPTVGNCLKWSASGIQDAGSTCGGGTGSPGGSSGAIQYNNAGAFGGVTVASGDLMAGGGSGAPTDTGVPYNAIPAANSTFTGPGTGGVATSLQARMQGEYVDFSDYGADCTGATDSTAAFTNAFNEAQTLGVPLHECVGTIQVNITTPLSITSGMNIGGAGRGLSWIENTSLTGTLFSIATTSPIYVHDIGYEVSGTPTAGAFITDAGLSAAQNVHSIFDRIQCTNAYYCLYLASSAYWNVDDSIFLNTVYRSIYVANTVSSDAGDSEISNSQFLEYQGNTCATTGVAIFQASSGGLRLVGNKFNCGSVQYNLQVAGSSSISLISGNSFENCSTHCIYITNTSSSFTWANVTITGNEISPYADVNAIYIQGSSGWLGNVSISGNTGVFAENSSAWARVDYATNLSFGVNSLSAPGTTSSYALDVSHGTVTSCHQVGNTVGSLTAVNGTCTNN